MTLDPALEDTIRNQFRLVAKKKFNYHIDKNAPITVIRENTGIWAEIFLDTRTS